MPGVRDRPNLGYTEAVLHESMRLASVAPTGIFHQTSCDTEVCKLLDNDFLQYLFNDIFLSALKQVISQTKIIQYQLALIYLFNGRFQSISLMGLSEIRVMVSLLFMFVHLYPLNYLIT